ncbi:hypothetical protein [Reichenbachiella versicolor]|uniref:hypothetical protein n=1 Tax=Reichenbachiella versicolor TaxID=1821036 RepID=UPI000D6E98CC|nr:hypothetical protein [Reichenbachiella versicolor]
MALIFSIYIETGNLEQTRVIEQCFLNHGSINWNGKEYQLQSFTATDGCAITPNGTSTTGIDTKEQCIEMSELGLKLYDILKSAPDFRFALVGVEVDDFVEFNDLINEPEINLDRTGLVINRLIKHSSELYSNYEQFNETHYWTPYDGEQIIKSFIRNGKWKSEITWGYTEDHQKG